MRFFSAAEMAGFDALSESAMDKSCAVYRPDYAGSASPTAVATVSCRVTRYPAGGGDVMDLSGEATHTLHLPQGTDARPGDEALVNGTHRYLCLPTNDGRSYQYDLQVAAKREA